MNFTIELTGTHLEPHADMATLHKPSRKASSERSSTPNLYTDSEIHNRRRSIRLLRDAIEYEPNEEKRFLLAEKLEELEELEAEAREGGRLMGDM